MRLLFFSFVLFLGAELTASAHLGDSVEQTVMRYGNPVVTTPSSIPGGLTSTRTFSKDGLEILCGYVGGKVEMIRYARADRPFVPAEVDAILHTNVVTGQPFTPDSASPGTYLRPDSTTAKVTDTSVDITTPKWLKSVAKDKMEAQNAASVAAATNRLEGAVQGTNTAP